MDPVFNFHLLFVYCQSLLLRITFRRNFVVSADLFWNRRLPAGNSRAKRREKFELAQLQSLGNVKTEESRDKVTSRPRTPRLIWKGDVSE